MKNLNTVLILGALAREGELRYTPSGTAVLDLTVAGERTVTGADGQDRTIPFYENVQALGKTAEAIAERGYTAGTALLIQGQLDYSQWTDEQGVKRSMLRTRLTGVCREVAGEAQLMTDGGGNQRLGGGLNEVELTGNLAADAELRYTPAGDAVLELRLGVNEKYKDRQGKLQEKTHWVTVTLWREQATSAAGLKKGDAVYVQGALVDDTWTDREGNKRRTKKVEASLCVPLARSGNGNARPAREPVAAAQPAPAAARTTRQAAPATQRSGGLDIDQGLDFPDEERDLPF